MEQFGKIKVKYITLIFCLIIFVLASFFLWGRTAPRSDVVTLPQAQSAPVQTALAHRADVPVTLQALGKVVSQATVNVVSQVDGQLIKVMFTEGDEVKKGQLLAQIDPRAYQAVLQRYRGELAENMAMLKSADEKLKRFRALQQRNLIARQELDDQSTVVDKLHGVIMATEAQIASAQLNLDFTRITAPISGRVGLRLIDEGNIILASENKAIVTLTQESPIAVTFSLPQENLPEIRAKQQHLALPLVIFDASNRHALAQCSLRYISNEIDSTTGSIKLKAVCDNRDGILYPSQLVNVHLQVALLKSVTVIPQRAIQYVQQSNFVYVVDADHRVHQRVVVPGVQYGREEVVLESGLAMGERVVTEGFAVLREGSMVEIISQEDGEKASGV
ncbi:efflux RND transporter periplasmic adaptor subunit [Pectobacterium aquaticum]|uniref:Efflux RND transporter periplasmic adaptor subunit n=1 Tax=Pectobacterium aquaticum TaxID=2204145 RepID=A0AA93DKR8_9GAMM|nr:efflux RND transporter periplasmic adaptor subunit [Pectobacterium aquaticum]RRO07141.1 efflux RND transporter periplasmic adaptor subunit [Pectobacterium aquaticum]RRO14500.1 efflux RND transporter periplasmic adaptor subunit [Pectobacterium aquaticum]